MTRVGVSGMTSYWAVRALVRETPEDFMTRIDTGLDEETRQSLKAGLQAARWVGRLQRSVLASAFVGGASLLGGTILARGNDALMGGFWAASLASWSLAFPLLVASVALVAYRRRDLHRLEAFIEATRRSSLARDLA